MNQSIDLKFRPRKFSQVLGNKGVRKLLLKRSQSGTLAGRSMLFGGPKGCGKTSLARITAQAIHCDNLSDGEPCGSCTFCRSIINDQSSDYEEFDAATQGTVDKIREIVKNLDFFSVNQKQKICILDEAQRLSRSAQDALLRVIEERRLIIIFCTTEPSKIQEAIKSRMEEYSILPPLTEELIDWMSMICKSESIKYDLDALRMISEISEKCPRICANSLDSLRDLGDVSVNNVKDYFHISSFELIDQIFRNIDFPAEHMKLLDSLCAEEGPTWVRDKMASGLVNLARIHYGVRSFFPIPLTPTNLPVDRLSNFASDLIQLDRPTISDIGAIMLKHTVAPAKTVRHTENVVNNEIKFQKNEIEPKFVKLSNSEKSIEIDGVKFSTSEHLTSLDGKIEKLKESPKSSDPQPKRDVGIDHAPIPESEFARDFLSFFK